MLTSEEVLVKIKEKLDSDSPLASKSDEEIAASLNSIDPLLASTKLIPVRCSTARGLVMAAGRWRAMAVASVTDSPIVDAAFTAYEALKLQDELSTENPAMYAVIADTLGALVLGGVLSRDLVDALLALAHQEIENSWATVNIEGRYVSPSDVAGARLI